MFLLEGIKYRSIEESRQVYITAAHRNSVEKSRSLGDDLPKLSSKKKKKALTPYFIRRPLLPHT